jgi:hypothetical protein
MAKTIEPTQVGKREDLRDIISNVDAKKYPLTSMAKKVMAPKNMLVEWQVDSYPSPSYDGVLDGEDVTTHENMAEDRTRLGTRAQKFRRSPMVSDMAENVSVVAGLPKGEMAKAIAKSIEMIKRDIECAFCGDRESQAQAGLNPYRTRGLGKWIQATAQSDLPVGALYLTPAASIDTTATASLTEALVNGVLASIWDQTGDDKTYQLLCGRTLKAKFSSFTQTQFGSTNVAASIRVFNATLAEKKIVATIDVYEGDFGTLELMLTAWNANESAVAVQRARGYVLDMELVSLAYHTPLNSRPLPDMGGGPRQLLEAIAALCVTNPLGLGKFAATS